MTSDPLTIPAPQLDCTPEQILLGEYVDPLDRIKLYSADKFEAFIQEWAYFYLQEICNEYVRVVRFGGAGDKGRDIVCYVDESPRICDVFQCKHYDHRLYPSDLWPELAKLCYHIFTGAIPQPRFYYIVAPQDIGSDLGRLLEDNVELKHGLIDAWGETENKGAVCAKIVRGRKTKLDGDLRVFVDMFDFSIIRHKPMQEIIEEHRKTIRHAPRFGGGLRKPLPPDPTPPEAPATHETQYVNQLLGAYQDKESDDSLDLNRLLSDPKFERYNKHLRRSRERFYCAEVLREFARDNLPEQFTFADVQEQVFDGVVDTAEQEHESGYDRAIATTRIAGSVQIMSHPLRSYVKGKSLMGICHQLVNDTRIYWVSTGGDNANS